MFTNIIWFTLLLEEFLTNYVSGKLYVHRMLPKMYYYYNFQSVFDILQTKTAEVKK